MYQGLYELMSRGQVYGGMATANGREITKIRTHRGLVIDTFAEDLDGLDGHLGLGVTSNVDRQPILCELTNVGSFVVGMDGYITNGAELRRKLLRQGCIFPTGEDVELLATIINQGTDLPDGIRGALERIEGPLAFTVMTPEAIYAARGIDGGAPLIAGEGGDGMIVASESCGFTYDRGWEILRDIRPGEAVRLMPDGMESLFRIEGEVRFCIFNWAYYGRYDSVIDGVHVSVARDIFSGILAEGDDFGEGYYVAPIPFSGIGHAQGYHLKSRLPLVQAYLPPQYRRRTYNLPIWLRIPEKARKLRVIKENVAGRKLVILDDSIRAGITIKDEIYELHRVGAVEVHVRIGSPPSIRYCPRARPPTKEEDFLASSMSVAEICTFINADSLRYVPLDRVCEAIKSPPEDVSWLEQQKAVIPCEENLCVACFLKSGYYLRDAA
ncbi:hypothetical protein KJ713_02150 [Patescibacteria group bacterium]|nr:hypothetical protein [Patescibacteria group bacterium]